MIYRFDFKHLVFWKGPAHFYDSSLSHFRFINIPGSTSVFPCLLPAAEENAAALMKARHGRRHRPPAYPSRPLNSPGILSREFLLTFLPLGKDFPKGPLRFLPVGKQGFQVSVFQPTDRTLTPAGAA